MRDRVEIAKRLLSARALVCELEHGGAGRTDAHPAERARLLAHRAVTQALSWALDVDRNQIDIPQTLLSLEEQPTTVQLHRLEFGPELGEAPHHLRVWLVEIPAHHDAAAGPDYSTEGWSCFLHDEQARQLFAALTTALTPPVDRRADRPLHLPALGRAGALRGISQSSQPPAAPSVTPAAPDVEGGYSDYAGLARLSPSGLAALSDDEDDEDDSWTSEDDDKEPPAASAATGGRGSR